MADLWSQREFALMHSTVCAAAEERYLAAGNFGTYHAVEVDGRTYSWSQTDEEVELVFRRTSAEAQSKASVTFKPRRLRVASGNVVHFDDELWAAVSPDDSTWSLEEDGTLLRVELQKSVSTSTSSSSSHPPWPKCGVREKTRKEEENRSNVLDAEAQARWNIGAAPADAITATTAAVAGNPGYSASKLADWSSDEDSDEDKQATRKKNITTGTAYLRQQLNRDRERQEEQLWHQGTKAASWASPQTPLRVGAALGTPLSTQEAWRIYGPKPT
mmetsp:Transcript_83006/g.182409  ORF Transcript_83006/g.182409 Transcript_83006/m.182409 type:complete len:273 (+) Transcript_83006:150-968(+)